MLKRGGIAEEQLFLLADMAFLVLIAFFLLSYLGSLQKDTTFEKMYLSRDLAMLLTTIQMLPGESIIDYPLPGPFTIEVTDNTILVSDEGLGAIEYPYVRLLSVVPQKISTAQKISLQKRSNMVTIS